MSPRTVLLSASLLGLGLIAAPGCNAAQKPPPMQEQAPIQMPMDPCDDVGPDDNTSHPIEDVGSELEMCQRFAHAYAASQKSFFASKKRYATSDELSRIKSTTAYYMGTWLTKYCPTGKYSSTKKTWSFSTGPIKDGDQTCFVKGEPKHGAVTSCAVE